MASKIYSSPRSREFTTAGTVLAGGKLYFYVAGTTTPATVYTSSALSVAHSHPILADTSGLFPAVWLSANVSYDITCKNSAEATQWTALNYSDALTADEVGRVIYPISAAETAAGLTDNDLTHQYIYGNVRRHGAVGSGADDTVAVQTALSLGGEVDLDGLECSVARNVSGSDRYGVYAAVSGTTIKNGTLKRYDASISTYALAYAPLLIGTPNSNAAAATVDVKVTGVKFIGLNTRHASAGSGLTDFRDAIVLKNTIGAHIDGCHFSAIDSAAITFQKPVSYDYANSVYHNTTKNYRAKITGCTFDATPHTTSGRALIHAINADGVDGLTATGNTFSYCDSCFGGETTYDGPDTAETDTYTPTVAGWALGAVRRSGRNWTFTGNTIYNSSEVAIYPAGVDVTVTGNTIVCDDSTLVSDAPIKVRCRGAAVSGNTISGYPTGVTVSVPSYGVTVQGNTITLPASADSSGGAIDLNASGLSAYIDARSDYFTGYPAMSGISVSGNTVRFPSAAAGATDRQSFVRLRTDDVADANYPEGQLTGVSITGNTSTGHNVALYVVGPNTGAVTVSGNVFTAKAFVSAGFAGGTTLNTRAVLQANASLSNTQLRSITFNDNTVHGATYLVCTTTGAGAGTFEMPWGFSTNRLSYIKNIKTADVGDFNTWNGFRGNVGTAFLDRTWGGEGLENSLADGTGSANSARRFTTLWADPVYRFYTDDAGTIVDLAL